MSTSEVFQKFYKQLVALLPLDDSLFLAELFTYDLLPNDLKGQIEASTTRADKATIFLDHRIRSEIHAGYSTSFTKLLNVMENSGDCSLTSLTREIRGALDGQPINRDNVAGKV